jgi:hypothetical protein
MQNPLLNEEDVKMKLEGIAKDSKTTDSVPCWLLCRLCMIGFFVNCQPSEPFLTRYLIKDKVRSIPYIYIYV